MTISPLRDDEVSRPGDSSSLWLARETRHAVGLHFAGSDVPERALAIDIQSVLTALDVDLDVGGRAGAERPRPSLADLLLAEIRRRIAVYACLTHSRSEQTPGPARDGRVTGLPPGF